MIKTSVSAHTNPTPAIAAFILLTLLVVATVAQQARAAGFCDLFNPDRHWSGQSHRQSWFPMMPAMPPWEMAPPWAAASQNSVIAQLRRSGGFGTLLTAIEAAGLTGLLEGAGPYTLFAPTDAAFAALPKGELQALLADKERLRRLVKYHVVPKWVSGAEVLSSSSLDTAAGVPLATADLAVSHADIRAGNGVIHVVDAVLMPAE